MPISRSDRARLAPHLGPVPRQIATLPPEVRAIAVELLGGAPEVPARAPRALCGCEVPEEREAADGTVWCGRCSRAGGGR